MHCNDGESLSGAHAGRIFYDESLTVFPKLIYRKIEENQCDLKIERLYNICIDLKVELGVRTFFNNSIFIYQKIAFFFIKTTSKFERLT